MPFVGGLSLRGLHFNCVGNFELLVASFDARHRHDTLLVALALFCSLTSICISARHRLCLLCFDNSLQSELSST